MSLAVIRTTEDAGALVSDEDEGALEPSGWWPRVQSRVGKCLL